MVQALAPIFFGTSSSISIFGVALTTSAGALTLAGAAFNLGAGLLISSALRPDIPAASFGPSNLKLNGAEETAPRIRSYGERRLGYARVFFDVKDGVLGRIIVHGHGQWSSIDRYFIDQSEVMINAGGNVTDEKFITGDINHIRIVSRLGLDSQPFANQIAFTFEYWNAAHKLNGLTYSALLVIAPKLSKINEMFPNREPNLEVQGRSSLLFDPRTQKTEYSANAALVIRDFLGHEDGFNRPDFVDEEYFRTAMDTCDEDIPLIDGGTAKRYEFHGSYSLKEPRFDVLQRMLRTCAGDLFFTPEGKVAIEVGDWYEPTFTLTEDMLISHQLKFGVDPINGYNHLAVKYEDPDLNFAIVDAEPWEDEARIISEGETTQEISVGGHTHMQARAVAKLMMEKDNPQSVLSVVCKPAAFIGFYETRIRVELPSFGISGVYRVTDKSLDPQTLAVSFELREIRQEAYALSLAEQGQKPVLPVTEDSSTIPLVANLTAAPRGVQTSQTTFTAGIGVAWSPAANASLVPKLEYAVAGSDDWDAVSLSEDAATALIGNLADGENYDVRMAWVTPGDATGEWSYDYNVVANASTAPPVAATGLSATDQGNGEALVSLTTSTSAALWKTIVFRDGVEIATFFDAPGQLVSFTDFPGVGTFAYTARSINVSDVPNNADAGPVNATIT